MSGLDNFHAVNMAIDHVVKNGFNNIIFIIEPSEKVYTRIERKRAFLDLIKDYNNIRYHIEETSHTDNEKIKSILHNFNESSSITDKKVIISANGALTINIIRELTHMNIIPGKDIGFLGIDDIEWADIIANGITTIKQPTEKIGYSAMKLLHSRINEPSLKHRAHTFHGELIIRGSTTLQRPQ